MPDEAPPPDRYASAPFPAYAYVPGRSPHPLRHAGGHRWKPPEAVARFDPERWSSCETYLLAIDLFNHGYYWEAHEALEGLWRSVGRRSEVGLRLQGLIQLAAALLKHRMGETRAARSLAARGAEKLRAGPEGALGVRGARLAFEVAACIAGRAPGPPRIELEGLAPE